MSYLNPSTLDLSYHGLTDRQIKQLSSSYDVQESNDLVLSDLNLGCNAIILQSTVDELTSEIESGLADSELPLTVSLESNLLPDSLSPEINVNNEPFDISGDNLSVSAGDQVEVIWNSNLLGLLNFSFELNCDGQPVEVIVDNNYGMTWSVPSVYEELSCNISGSAAAKGNPVLVNYFLPIPVKVLPNIDSQS